MANRGLGRGLDALLGQAAALTPLAVAPDPTAVSAATSRAPGGEELPIDRITPNPFQPRKTIDPEQLEKLTASIRTSGVVQPVVVRRVGDGWQLVAGERRWRAARAAGLATIPVVVRAVSDAEALELALVENLLREDLNPMEEAEGYQRLLQEFAWTQEVLAARVGRDRASVSNCLRLLRLPVPIQDDLRAGRLTMGHARALLALGSPAQQLELRDEMLHHSWSVRATEEQVQRRRAVPPRARRREAELVALEEALERTLMTRVRLVGNARRGRIEVVYATPDELERVSSRLLAGHP